MAENSLYHHECTICLGDFKQPKILPCFHTFCLECLRRHLEIKAYRGKFPCPLCRLEIAVPPGGVKEFQTNFYIENERQEQAGTQLLCNTCTFNFPVHSRCLDCNEYFCKICGDSHRKMKMSKDHRYIEISKTNGQNSSVKRNVFCSSHTDKMVEFFCKKCKIIICPSCKLTKHEGHPSEDMTETAADLRQNIENILTSNVTEERLNSISHKKTSISGMRSEVASMRSSKVAEIRERASGLFRKIDERCRDLIIQINTSLQNDVNVLDRTEEDLDRMSMSIKTLHDTAQQMLQISDDVDLIERGFELCNALQEATEIEPVNCSRSQLAKVFFLPGDTLLHDIDDLLGKVCVQSGEVTDHDTEQTELKVFQQSEETGRQNQAEGLCEHQTIPKIFKQSVEIEIQNKAKGSTQHHTVPKIQTSRELGQLHLISSFSIGGDYGISGICVRRDGKCWISNCTSTLTLVDVGGETHESVDVGMDRKACGVVIDDDSDSLFVTFYDDKCIYKLQADNELYKYVSLPFSPRALAVDYIRGCMMVCGGKGKGVVSVPREGQWTYRSPFEVNFHYARDIAVNCDGFICVTDPYQKQISIFSYDGRHVAIYTGPTELVLENKFRPRGVCCDNVGNFVVTDSDNYMINIVNHFGESLTTYRTAHDCRGMPYSVVMDNFGRLWVGFARGEIRVYDMI